ncbi:MAG: hypothetical protein ACJAS4_002783 [Bacteriovoracaceae bacterium]|jgi:hypothetical protein
MKQINEYVPKHLMRNINDFKEFLFQNPKTKVGLIAFLAIGSIYVASKFSETQKVVYKDHRKPVFSEGRIFGSQASSYLKSKEAQLGKTARKIMANNKLLEEKLKLLEKRMEAKS